MVRGMSYILSSEPPLDPPDPTIAYICDVCGEPIYVGDEYFPFEVDIVCTDCIRDYVERNFMEIAEIPEPDYEED